MKSVVIIGKGPSVSKSTKEFVDSFDEVAICNFPPMENYEHFISNRATYHFLNAGDPFPYRKDFINTLGLTHIFNTSISPNSLNADTDCFLPDHPVSYSADYGLKTTGMVYDGKLRVDENSKYEFWPSTGMLCFDYFYNSPEHTKIGLVGIDCYQKGLDAYYFGLDETKPALHYLWNNSTYSLDGKVINHIHGESGERELMTQMIQESEKEFVWLKM